MNTPRPPDPSVPATLHYHGAVALSRSQTRVLADALEPFVQEQGGTCRPRRLWA